MSARMPHPPLRAQVIELIARARTAAAEDPIADERYFLDQLRAALAAETPAERLRDQYGADRPDRLARLYARYRD